MKLKYLFILILVPLLSGCDQTDDVSGIFLGKTWKLTGIMDNNVKPIDYWNDEAAWEKSQELKAKAENYIMKFEGLETDGVIEGTFTGYVTSVGVSGNWSADGKSNSFSFSKQAGTDQDILGNAFIRAMNTAYKYEGDYNNLRIYFHDGQTKGFLSFTVQGN